MPVSIIVCAIAIVGAGLAALGWLAWARFGEYGKARRRNSANEECSLERYQPMVRLLAREDADFLRQNTHCPKAMANWDRSRRRIIRLYLRELAADFHRLHAKSRFLVAQSPEQCSRLVPLLFKQQFTFWRILVLIELRLSFGGAGIFGEVNVEELVRTVEVLQREISRAVTASAA